MNLSINELLNEYKNKNADLIGDTLTGDDISGLILKAKKDATEIYKQMIQDAILDGLCIGYIIGKYAKDNETDPF